MKYLITILAIFLFISCEKEEEAPQDVRTADIQVTLVKTNMQYGFDLDIENTGNRTIIGVNIPYTITFSSGKTDSRTIYIPPVTIEPGASESVSGFIRPANSNPYNPRYITYSGDIVNVKYSGYELSCK
jgi:hypothetical protein